MKGSYQSADFGLAKNGIRALTGAPAFTLPTDIDSSDKVFSEIRDCLAKGYIVGTQTSGQSDTQQNKYGIPEAHAYTVLAAFTVTRSGQQHSLYMIRNPWSESKYKGQWNPKDPRWTDDVKR
jgi:hypothetical protein